MKTLFIALLLGAFTIAAQAVDNKNTTAAPKCSGCAQAKPAVEAKSGCKSSCCPMEAKGACKAGCKKALKSPKAASK